jgi:hypothetical protein
MAVDPKRVKEIFLEATELPDEAARAAYLDRACQGDVGLRERVEALLRSHDPAGSFLGTPVVVMPDPDADDTRTFGSNSAATADEEQLGFLGPATRHDSLGRIAHYEVLEVLGRGGFGIVFRAFDDLLHRVVAIKVLAPEMAATSPARKRFLREARAVAQVRHENVVQIYAVEEQPLPFLVMEYIPGETLQARLDRAGPFESAEVVAIGRQIAGGLAAAHAAGLIHRDVKPANILIELSPALRVKITDFGLARAADDASLSRSGAVFGTPLYMSPEQAAGANLDHRSDLFSLGSVLYAITSGRPPFRAESTLAVLKRVAEDTPRPIPEVVPEAPAWLCGIIARLMAKKRDHRFQSAAQVITALEEHRLPPLPDHPPAEDGGGRKRLHLKAALLGLLGVAVISSGVALLYLSLAGTGRGLDPARKDTARPEPEAGQSQQQHDGPLLFADDFVGPPLPKPLLSGSTSWSQADGIGLLTVTAGGLLPVLYEGVRAKNFIAECECRVRDNREGFAHGLVFRSSDVEDRKLDRYYSVHIETDRRLVSISRWQDNRWDWLGRTTVAPELVRQNVWHKLRFKAVGGNFQLFLDGEKVLENVAHGTATPGIFGLHVYSEPDRPEGAYSVEFRKLRVWSVPD